MKMLKSILFRITFLCFLFSIEYGEANEGGYEIKGTYYITEILDIVNGDSLLSPSSCDGVAHFNTNNSYRAGLTIKGTWKILDNELKINLNQKTSTCEPALFGNLLITFFDTTSIILKKNISRDTKWTRIITLSKTNPYHNTTKKTDSKSLPCQTNYSLYREYLKVNNNYTISFKYWKLTFDHCQTLESFSNEFWCNRIILDGITICKNLTNIDEQEQFMLGYDPSVLLDSLLYIQEVNCIDFMKE